MQCGHSIQFPLSFEGMVSSEDKQKKIWFYFQRRNKKREYHGERSRQEYDIGELVGKKCCKTWPKRSTLFWFWTVIEDWKFTESVTCCQCWKNNAPNQKFGFSDAGIQRRLDNLRNQPKSSPPSPTPSPPGNFNLPLPPSGDTDDDDCDIISSLNR